MLNQHNATEIWRQTLSDTVRDDKPDLTARQMGLLLTVYTASPPHTAPDLAGDLEMSKPAVTRALDTLGRMDLLRRKRDERNKRGDLIQRTIEGSVYLSEYAESNVNAATVRAKINARN